MVKRLLQLKHTMFSHRAYEITIICMLRQRRASSFRCTGRVWHQLCRNTHPHSHMRDLFGDEAKYTDGVVYSQIDRLYCPTGKFVFTICHDIWIHKSPCHPTHDMFRRAGTVQGYSGRLSAEMADGTELLLERACLHLRVLYLRPDGSSVKCGL